MTTTDPPAGTARFRVKRAEVEALQWTGSNITEMTAFAGSEFSYYPDAERGEEAGVLTSRYSSWETLIPGQWVLRGPHGLFVVGSQQFAEDYEPMKPLAVPEMSGDGWDWEMYGDVLTITNGGWIEVNHDREVWPTAEQWGEIAAVALYQQHRAAVREANATEGAAA